MEKHTQYLAIFEDIENGMISYITMNVRKNVVSYVSVLRDEDAEENVSVVFYPIDKFDFKIVYEITKKLL